MSACHINTKVFPFKLHYFLLIGAYGSALPYLPILAKDLGINVSAVGITYALLPLGTFLSRPFFGFLADYFKNIKIFIVGLLVACTASTLSILVLSPLHDESVDDVKVVVELSNTFWTLPFVYRKSCITTLLGKDIKCLLRLGTETNSEQNTTQCEINLKKSDYMEETVLTTQNVSITDMQNLSNNSQYLILRVHDTISMNETCGNFENYTSPSYCEPDINHCLPSQDMPWSLVYSSHQFWIFTFLAVVSGAAADTTISLTDTASSEALGDDRLLFGRQRLWGTIGTGVMCPVAGLLNDIASNINQKRYFSPGFYIMIAFALLDILVLRKVRMIKSNAASDMCGDLKRIISSAEIMTFALGVFVIGTLNALITTYEFWYLEDLGASQSLLGTSTAMRCLVGEVPFFFFSGWFVKKFGHFLCLGFSFAGFALRLGLYSIIRNPWLVLPIDITHGLTFAVLCAAMTSFASTKGPSGMEATMLGILGGLYQGLGSCVGSFIGGIAFVKLGGRRLFWTASIFSLACIPLLSLLPFTVKKIKKQTN